MCNPKINSHQPITYSCWFPPKITLPPFFTWMLFNIDFSLAYVVSNHYPSTMTGVFLLELRTFARDIILLLGTHTYMGPLWLAFLHGSLLEISLDEVIVLNQRKKHPQALGLSLLLLVFVVETKKNIWMLLNQENVVFVYTKFHMDSCYLSLWWKFVYQMNNMTYNIRPKNLWKIGLKHDITKL